MKQIHITSKLPCLKDSRLSNGNLQYCQSITPRAQSTCSSLKNRGVVSIDVYMGLIRKDNTPYQIQNVYPSSTSYIQCSTTPHTYSAPLVSYTSPRAKKDGSQTLVKHERLYDHDLEALSMASEQSSNRSRTPSIIISLTSSSIRIFENFLQFRLWVCLFNDTQSCNS